MTSRSDKNMSLPKDQDSIWIVYDGECPMCKTYIGYTRLKAQYSNVTLVNAREDHPILSEIKEAGYDLDEGMILKINDRFYHGDECIHMLSMMTTDSGVFNRLNSWVFKSQSRARFLYPILKCGRNTLLFLLGRKKINQ